MIFEEVFTQKLDTLPVRDGYNSASISYNLDSASGDLTATLTDSSSLTTASETLTKSPKTLTVRLRTVDGGLEWTSATEDTWQALDGVTDVIAALCRITETVGFGKHEEITGCGVVVANDDRVIRFRAREWKKDIDLITDAYLNGGANLDGGSNAKFNTIRLGEISSAVDFGSIGIDKSYVSFKNVTDDVAPLCMNGTYIGANHGYETIAEIPNTPGLTEVDIGSVWQVGEMKYVLVRLPSESKLWLCPYYDEAMETGRFAYQAIKCGDTVTHISGATHKESFIASEDSQKKQFQIAVNNRTDKVFLDGINEVDLSKGGYRVAEFVDYYEKYNIIYLPETLKYLTANVGKNTNDSYRSDVISDSYVTVRNTYRYHKNGACVIYASYEFNKDISLGYIGCVQSVKFDEPTHYIYAPGTTDISIPTLQPENREMGRAFDVGIGSDNLADPDKLVTSYFQFTDANGTKAMNLGYNPLYGAARNDFRKSRVTMNSKNNLGWYYVSYKMYPRLISGGRLMAGDKITAVAYNIPSYILDDDFTAINWYWVGEDIYLSLHTDKALDKTVTVLPNYMNGMEITVIEGSDTFTVSSAVIEEGCVCVTTTGAGYAILRLSSHSK